MSESGPDLIVRVREDLIRAGFHLDDPESGTSVRAGLHVYAVDSGVVVHWRPSDHVGALPSRGDGAEPAEQTLRTAVHLALVGLLAQAGHTITQDPGSGDIIVITRLR
ncbi:MULTISPECIES: hypothetical protein [unclassified Nonomuraea]|uniref:hypothetical protein n=1 Tax=unclassified Nonomuraea TaxID=2593643 RepID=UPI0033F6EDC2